MRRNANTMHGGQIVNPISNLVSNKSLEFSKNEQPHANLINCYKCFQELGHGSFGEVFLVENITKQKFAMKIAPPKAVKYLQREREFLDQFKDSKIGPIVHDAFEYRDKYCMVMTYCEQPLSAFIHDQLTFKQMKTLMKLAAGHLNQVHSQNVIHTDIKTDNFLLQDYSNEYSLKLIDFSSSIQLPCEHMPSRLQSRYFKSPEVLHKQQYGLKIDMWSLGCLFYEIVFKRPLFPSKTDEMLVLQHLCLLGLPDYAIDQFSGEFTESRWLCQERVYQQYGLTKLNKRLPNQAVLNSTGRPECNPRKLNHLVEGLQWQTDQKRSYLNLLQHLLLFDPSQRWSCSDVLNCDFLKD